MTRKKNTEALAFFMLLLLSVIAVSMVICGASVLYHTAALTQSGLAQTQRALENGPRFPQFEDEFSALSSPDPAAISAAQVDASGSAILTVFTEQEHRYAVYDGLTQDHLALGTARLAEGAAPGKKGNCVIFGHRDSSFRCLKDVAVGDKITLATAEAVYTYLVEKTQICAPTDGVITAPSAEHRLTLVTCYPFVYSGPALERYLVQCKLDTAATRRLPL